MSKTQRSPERENLDIAEGSSAEPSVNRERFVVPPQVSLAEFQRGMEAILGGRAESEWILPWFQWGHSLLTRLLSPVGGQGSISGDGLRAFPFSWDRRCVAHAEQPFAKPRSVNPWGSNG